MDRRNFIVASSGYALSALDLPDMDGITRRTRNASSGGPAARGAYSALVMNVLFRSGR